MPNSDCSRAVAKLSWEAASERLQNALQNPNGSPAATREDLAEALRVVEEAVAFLRSAYEVPSCDAPHGRKDYSAET